MKKIITCVFKSLCSRPVVYLVVAVSMALAFLTGCAEKQEPFNGKVLILGFDAATWYVMDPMIKMGELPNLKKLMDQGGSASLSPYVPAQSPLIWTSMVTGKTPEKHGVEFFVTRLPHEYESIPIDSGSRKTKALWNILSEKGISSTFISWWATWPAEKVDGYMLSDRFATPGIDKATYPEELAAELRKEVSLRDKDYISSLFTIKYNPGWPDDVKEEYDKFIDGAKWDILRLDAAKYMLRTEDTRVNAVYFRHLDGVQHVYWKYMEPDGFDVTEEEVDDLGGLVKDYYRFVDHIVGELLSLMPPDTLVVILSDHGMASFTPAHMGYMKRKKYIGMQDGHFVLRYPQLNHLLGRLGYMRFADDKREKIDWDKTRVFAEDTEHLEWKRTLLVNGIGEFPNGIVEKKDYGDLLSELSDKLMALKTANGKKVILDVEPDPQNGRMVVQMNTDISVEDSIMLYGRKHSMKEFIGEFYNSGEHGGKEDGILIVSGPNIRQGNGLKHASVLDITPTLLYSMGLPVGRDMDGKVLLDLFDSSFVKSYPVDYIDSYDGNGRKAAERGGKTEVDKEMKDRLKALGYIQ